MSYLKLADAFQAITFGADIGNVVGNFGVLGVGSADCVSGEAIINFKAENVTGLESFTRNPFTGNSLLSNQPTGFGATMKEKWTWTESMNIGGGSDKCNCKK